MTVTSPQRRRHSKPDAALRYTDEHTLQGKMKSTMLSNILEAGLLLLGANIATLSSMFIVYLVGNQSLISWVLIYVPILAINTVSLRDQAPLLYILSQWLAIAHGLAHQIFPFLDEHVGVNRSVDVWQDQILHLGQALLFVAILFSQSSKVFRTLAVLFVVGSIINVALGYTCWGQPCHDLYVWLALVPALASGLHHATGALVHTSRDVAVAGFAMQGTSSILTYFLFKSSDDILKTFALSRFFELYFIAPHYVGFFYSRYRLFQKAEETAEARVSDEAHQQAKSDARRTLESLAPASPKESKSLESITARLLALERENAALKQRDCRHRLRGRMTECLVVLGISPGKIGSPYLPPNQWKRAIERIATRSFISL